MSKFIAIEKLKAIFSAGTLPKSTADVLARLTTGEVDNLLDAEINRRRFAEKKGEALSISRALLTKPNFGPASLEKLVDYIFLEIGKLVSEAEDQGNPNKDDDVALAIPIACELIRRTDPAIDIGGRDQTSLYAEIAIDFVQALRRKKAQADYEREGRAT